jgi:hypothetical protein
MTKPLIAVMTCHRNQIGVAAQRETWANNCPLKFFYGVGNRPYSSEDEIFLPVPDTYRGLVEKVKASITWARSQGYTHFFKCDDDVYLRPERLLTSGYEAFDYLGSYIKERSSDYPHGYMHGGAGYWLSSKAMDIIINSPIDRISEDGWVANKLFEAGIQGHREDRFVYVKRADPRDPKPVSPQEDNEIILAAEFLPSEMRKIHRQWLSKPDPTESMSAEQYKQYILKGGKP